MEAAENPMSHVSEMSEMRMEKDKGPITKSLQVDAKDSEFHPEWENHWRILKTEI